MDNSTCRDRFQLYDLYPAVTNYTDEQIEYYCPFYERTDQLQHNLYFALGLTFAITGAIGLVNNVLTFVTFSKGDAFKGPSFLYHKAMAILELSHTAIMLEFGILRSLQYPGNTYWMAWWRDCAYGGWMIGDSVKTAVNCLVMFVSLERMIAVWFPFKFDLINRNHVVVGAIVVSVLIGALHLPGLAALHVVTRSDGYMHGEFTKFGESALYAISLKVINTIKLALGGVTFVLCALVALGMYRSNQRAAKMSTDAKNRWKNVKMACYLQLTLGITTVMAHITFVALKTAAQQEPFPHIGKDGLTMVGSFDELMANLWRSAAMVSIEVVNAFVAQLDHCGRFFFYLIFHSTFRSTFETVWKGVWKTKVVPLSEGKAEKRV